MINQSIKTDFFEARQLLMRFLVLLICSEMHEEAELNSVKEFTFLHPPSFEADA